MVLGLAPLMVRLLLTLTITMISQTPKLVGAMSWKRTMQELTVALQKQTREEDIENALNRNPLCNNAHTRAAYKRLLQMEPRLPVITMRVLREETMRQIWESERQRQEVHITWFLKNPVITDGVTDEVIAIRQEFLHDLHVEINEESGRLMHSYMEYPVLKNIEAACKIAFPGIDVHNVNGTLSRFFMNFNLDEHPDRRIVFNKIMDAMDKLDLEEAKSFWEQRLLQRHRSQMRFALRDIRTKRRRLQRVIKTHYIF
jgi:hypothetical protein